MSKTERDANEVLRLQAEVERLEAEAAAMREALEEAGDAIGELGEEKLVEETGNKDWRGISNRIERAHGSEASRSYWNSCAGRSASATRRGPAFDALARAGETMAGIRAAGYGDVNSRVERRIVVPVVVGSNPIRHLERCGGVVGTRLYLSVRDGQSM